MMLLQDSLAGKVPAKTQVSDLKGEGNFTNGVYLHGEKGQCEKGIFLFCCQGVNSARCGACPLKRYSVSFKIPFQ